MKKILKVVFFLLVANSLFAQTVEEESFKGTINKDLANRTAQVAISNPDYMVTSGDIYTLSYIAGTVPVSYSILVDSSYKIKISNLATLDATGKSYLTLKRQVEEIVSKNYPMSGVQFVLTQPSSFMVTVKGEVTSTREINAWPLSRLSSIIAGCKTAYSSTRDVTIISKSGKKTTYDLFKATRFGDLSQDPYVRPGDVIVLNKYKRKVTISGSVERPGTYELLEGENLKTLVTYYANGLTDLADTTRMTLTRINESESKSGNKIYLDTEAIEKDTKVINGDVISIPSRESLMPYVLVEGVIQGPEANVEGEKTEAPKNQTYKKSVRFFDGENYASFVRRIEELFTENSDLKNAYVEREGNKLPIDLEQIMYDGSFISPLDVVANDKLVIPYQQYFSKILVTGEVTTVVEKEAWPLKRLSEVISDCMTSYSSTRNIVVTNVEGESKTYDLFKAKRFGDMENNPYIRAGETVTINRISRKVTISGSVERPGTYELLEGENLKTLVTYYANGLTEQADTTRMTLTRINESESKSGNKIYLDTEAIEKDTKVINGDVISIPSRESLMPYVLVEGVIQGPEANVEGEKTEAPKNQTYKKSVRFFDGENYASFVRRIEELFTENSDLKNAYVEREGNKLPIDLEQIMYDGSFISPLDVVANDKLVIPYQQYFSKILVTGEVTTVVEKEAWPLKRLSEVISDCMTSYSSTRNIVVTNVEGESKTYDLFKAKRFGDMENNPYIRAGETVTINRISRKVTISGSVERPGTYELLEGENLKTLVTYYANGLTERADTTRMEVLRYLDTDIKTGQKIYLNQSVMEEDFSLVCYDQVSIPSYESLKPVIFVEGAVNVSAGDSGTQQDASNRIPVRFNIGTNYAQFVRSNIGLFSAVSDTENAYIIRKGEIIPLNVSEMLYDANFYSDFELEENDILRIPFKQLFVIVSGAVNQPGKYPYIPDRTYDYYVNLAGGFVTEKNTGDAVKIVDINGEKLNKKDYITPETIIDAKSNSFLYFFNQYAPIVTTLLSTIGTVLSVIAVTQAK